MAFKRFPDNSKNYLLLNAGGTALTGATSITVNSIGGMEFLKILVIGASSVNTLATFSMTFNSVTSGYVYSYGGVFGSGSGAYNVPFNQSSTNATNFPIGKMNNNVGSVVSGLVAVEGASASGLKHFQNFASGNDVNGFDGARGYYGGGFVSIPAAISSVTISSDTGNFDAGTIYIYGSPS